MKAMKTKRLAITAVSGFLVISCVAMYMSLSSGTAPLRGSLPSISAGSWLGSGDIEIYPDEVPLAEFEEPEEIDPYEEFNAVAAEIAASMTEDERLYQLFFVTPEQLTGFKRVYQSGRTTSGALEQKPVGGLIYFAANLDTAAQTLEMLTKTQEYAGLPLFLGVDEEGGRVARVSGQKSMGFDSFPAMAEIGSTGDTQQAYDTGVAIGEMLASLGFNVDFAPVADVLINPNNSEIGDRSFGTDAALVSDMTAAYTAGLRSAGLASSLKHFPGHGSTVSDSHNGYSESTRTLDEMREEEFLPFIAGIAEGTDFVLMSHMSAVNIDSSGAPASLSEYIITDLLRGELGYERIVITDSLSMGAVTQSYTGGEASVQAILAGADMILMPENLDEAVEALRTAIADGRLTWERIDESVQRILAVKLERGIVPMDYLSTVDAGTGE